MENLSLKRIVGSSDRSNAYSSSNDYELNSEQKSEQRERILRFILNNHDSSTNIKYLGLPGKYWFLENRLINKYPKAKVTGIEKNARIFTQSKIMMPGSSQVSKNITVGDTVKLEMYRTSAATSIYGKLSSLTDSEIIEKSIESGTYKKGLLNRTVIWYDFTTSFNTDSFITLYNIKNIVHPHIPSVICVTMMYGRDLYFNGKGEAARAEIMQRALPGFVPDEIWTYKGFKGTPMINICGIYHP